MVGHEPQILKVECPACGALLNEQCESNTGHPRITPHWERILAAVNKAQLRIPNHTRTVEFKEQLEQFAHLLVDIFLSLPPEERAKYSKQKREL